MYKYRENLFINCKNQQDQNFAFGNYKSTSHESLYYEYKSCHGISLVSVFKNRTPHNYWFR